MSIMKEIIQNIKEFYNKYKNKREEKSYNKTLELYYMNMEIDKRKKLAKKIDYIFLQVFFFFLAFIIIYMKSKKLWISTILSSIIIYLYYYSYVYIHNKKLKKFQKVKKKEIAKQRIYKEILNRTIDEMEEYLINLFKQIGFSCINQIYSNNNSVLLKSIYNNKEILIYYKYCKNTNVELKDLKEFLLYMKNYKIKRAIFITNYSFTSESNDFVKDINNKYKVLLINKDILLDMIEHNNMFLTNEEINSIIKEKVIEKNKSIKKYKSTIFSNEKKKGYLLSSIYLAISGFYMTYTAYYIIVAYILLFLFIVTFIINFKKENDGVNLWSKTKELLDEM